MASPPRSHVTMNEAARATAPLAAAGRPILLWGPKNSGKSTFLASMLLIPADAEGPDRWRMVAADARTSEYAADLLHEIARTRSLRPTLVVEEPYRFRLQEPPAIGLFGRRRPPREHEVVLLDPSGELFQPQRLRSGAGLTVLETAVRARGLVLLIDATDEQAGARYWEMFEDNIGELVRAIRGRPDARGLLDRHGFRLTVPTAVCLTKMDRFDRDRLDPAAFLRERLGSAFQHIQLSFTNYRIFACSALGEGGDATPAADGSPQLPRPWGLLEPFQWIVRPGRDGLLR